VVIDKEAGWTSHDVVAKLRGLLGQRRTGHAGTLDPSATGVLLVGLGRATRLLRFLQETTKSYEGELVLGATTTSLDADGDVTARFDMTGVETDEVAAAARALTGELLQVPPMVSAIQIDGVRLHDLARQGIEVERAPRPVSVARFDVAATDDPLRWRFLVTCSSGTYVRSLVDDLGRSLGGGAHLATLRRTQVGAFSLADAHLLDEIAERAAREGGEERFDGLVLSPAQALRGLPHLVVAAPEAARIATGAALDAPDGAPESGPVALLDEGGRLLAVYEAFPEGRLRASVVLAGAGAS
jgi:tRNA pseudouridine55 synthase